MALIVNDIFNRPGIFRVTKDALHTVPEFVLRVQSEVVVVRAEAIEIAQVFEYHGFSGHFDICRDGDAVPVYEFRINNRGILAVKRTGETVCWAVKQTFLFS